MENTKEILVDRKILDISATELRGYLLLSDKEKWKKYVPTEIISDFEKIREKVPNKLWLRNNISTIISNCSENFFFAFLAFVGLFDIQTILSIAITGSIIEIIIAICDTPFLYIAKKDKVENLVSEDKLNT